MPVYLMADFCQKRQLFIEFYRNFTKLGINITFRKKVFNLKVFALVILNHLIPHFINCHPCWVIYEHVMLGTHGAKISPIVYGIL